MTPSEPLKPRPKGFRKRAPTLDRAPIRHGYVQSFDGTRLFYSVEGEGRPLVFCYGLVCSSLHWTYQIDHFRQNYQTIWFDYRGHQNSDMPKDLSSLTLENMARDLSVVLDDLGIRDAVFLGHSMGVNVVLELVRQQPERVRGMVLANGTAQRPLETLFRHNTLQTGFQLLAKAYQRLPKLVTRAWALQKNNPFTRTLVSMGGFNPHLTPKEDIDLYIQQVAEMDPAVLINLIGNYGAYDATSWLHRIQCPTLILAGQQDNVIPLEQQELMHQLIAGSRLDVIKHGSHCPQMDLPELVDLRIEKFLKELNYDPTSSPSTETSNRASPMHPDRGRIAAS